MVLAPPRMSSDAENKEVSHAILENPLISVLAVNLYRMTRQSSLRPRLSGPFSSCAISQRVRPAKWVYARPHLVIVGCGRIPKRLPVAGGSRHRGNGVCSPEIED